MRNKVSERAHLYSYISLYESTHFDTSVCSWPFAYYRSITTTSCLRRCRRRSANCPKALSATSPHGFHGYWCTRTLLCTSAAMRDCFTPTICPPTPNSIRVTLHSVHRHTHTHTHIYTRTYTGVLLCELKESLTVSHYCFCKAHTVFWGKIQCCEKVFICLELFYRFILFFCSYWSRNDLKMKLKSTLSVYIHKGCIHLLY